MISVEEVNNPSFAGHESFPLRYAWLPKGVRAVMKHRDLFSRDDALVLLGVGKNMVRSIRHWGLTAGFLDQEPATKGGASRGIVPSNLGALLFGPDGCDPYLEDPATLWLIHWQVAARPDGPTTWYWAFNEYPDAEFTKEKLVLALRQFIERAGWKRIADASLERDVECLVRTYVASSGGKGVVLEESLDCPLTDLSLLHAVDGLGVYAFNRGAHQSLPHAVFTYALLNFWRRTALAKRTIPFDHLAYHAGSPGRVFKLSDDALTDYLEAVESMTKGAIVYGVTAGLRQLYQRRELDAEEPIRILRRYYGEGK